jgi:hypothetical protein
MPPGRPGPGLDGTVSRLGGASLPRDKLVIPRTKEDLALVANLHRNDLSLMPPWGGVGQTFPVATVGMAEATGERRYSVGAFPASGPRHGSRRFGRRVRAALDA